jgi:hypothetical protein
MELRTALTNLEIAHRKQALIERSQTKYWHQIRRGWFGFTTTTSDLNKPDPEVSVYTLGRPTRAKAERAKTIGVARFEDRRAWERTTTS